MTNNQVKIIEKFIQLGLIDDVEDEVRYPFVTSGTFENGKYEVKTKSIMEITDISDWNPSLLVMDFDGNTRRYYALV